MLALIPALLLLPAVALAGVLHPPNVPELETRAEGAVSPNKTCGMVLAGANQGATCPGEVACCSQYGYCGTGDVYCLTTGGCQTRYSNTSASCYAPKSGSTISIDGTCGTTGAGKAGYKCPTTGATCCSVAGYCGNTTEHCDVNNGCQTGFGTCTGTKTPPKTGTRSSNLFDESN
ncbi:carbohydrate-binding module family 18 protein [Diplogelasinospora grovesii]|uniref:Carbohydrate-binding module family 18 protein n=1 Tax=Diplogelasinospora grovesii TaxID=303347 RepID=A0AAN6N4Q9_9PEZI|nr:carbohydrate-binding module family 18 protein [Diplogelasinospora grovesii]